ncbi:hypothetical protein [Microbacterium halotolerans]|uniref:hypothetical protein n=1 Tax=Microbacterium halotolerans TaxID=246613 RepID=UPI000E6AC736|nr:hypothetical protein [Microbacterium halotolerans]
MPALRHFLLGGIRIAQHLDDEDHGGGRRTRELPGRNGVTGAGPVRDCTRRSGADMQSAYDALRRMSAGSGSVTA